jgi:hypothetical protein
MSALLFRLNFFNFFFEKVVISQFLIFLNPLHLIIMKALRIKTSDQALNLSRFEIVLLKDIANHHLDYQLAINEAFIQLELHQGEQFLLSLGCDEPQFEKFKLRWERFQENEDYYFDLSEWGSVK